MKWQDVLSMAGMYVLLLILVCAAHLFAAFMDRVLYDANKYNDNRKTKRIGMNRLFWRCKKDDNKEIFTIAFIHEVISLFLFFAVTIMFIMTLIRKEEIIMFIGFVPVFIYFLYSALRQKTIKRSVR